jgi:hypothetical protein
MGHLLEKDLPHPMQSCREGLIPFPYEDLLSLIDESRDKNKHFSTCMHLTSYTTIIYTGYSTTTHVHFTKWGVDFMTCHPASARGHRYIIVVIDYFTKWVEAMPTFSNDGETTTLFIFNQVIARFRVPREIVTDHGSHFQNRMMSELASKLGFR